MKLSLANIDRVYLSLLKYELELWYWSHLPGLCFPQGACPSMPVEAILNFLDSYLSWLTQFIFSNVPSKLVAWCVRNHGYVYKKDRKMRNVFIQSVHSSWWMPNLQSWKDLGREDKTNILRNERQMPVIRHWSHITSTYRQVPWVCWQAALSF